MPKSYLPKDIARVLEALLYYLVPEAHTDIYRGLNQEVLVGSERILREFQWLIRFGFFLGVRLFNWLPFLFGYGFTQFTRLSPEMQTRYAESWALSRLSFKREFFQGLKGLVLVVCFSNQRLWKEIGYEPKTHLAGRIQMRQDLMKATQ